MDRQPYLSSLRFSEVVVIESGTEGRTDRQTDRQTECNVRGLLEGGMHNGDINRHVAKKETPFLSSMSATEVAASATVSCAVRRLFLYCDCLLRSNAIKI